jgi:hypothetical protein
MATVRAGDLRQVTINGREYDPKGDSGVEFFLGGYANEIESNGNGVPHPKQKRVMGGFTGLALSIDDARGDIEALQKIANAPDTVPVNITLPSGIVYSGALFLIGEVKKSTADGTATIEMRGAKWEQI